VSIGQVPRTLTMKRPPAVPCRGTERLLDHDTSLPTDSDDGQCLCEQRQHTPVTSGDTTLSECRSLASLPKRCCRPSPLTSSQPIHPIPTTQSSPRDLRKRHRSRPRRVSAPSPAECRFKHRRSRLELRWIVEANDQSGLRGSELNAWGDTHGCTCCAATRSADHLDGR
jgi:hypothetical protein